MNLTNGEISKHVQDIAIPASLGFFFNTMFNIADTYFAGWISTQALAALSVSFPVFFIILAFVQGLATGSSALISNALGSKDEKSVEQLSAQVLSYGLMCYLLITPFGLVVSRPVFEMLGAKGDYLHMATEYMDVIFIGSLFFTLLYAANSILLAHGNSKIMRNFMIGGFFLNAALDPWFMLGGYGLPAMGLRGIALATVFVMFLGCVYVNYQVYKRGYYKEIELRDFIPRGDVFLRITKQSLPASLNYMTIGLGIFVITYFIKDFGEAAVAAYGIGTRIEQIFLLPTIGLTVATLAIIGQNHGAKYFHRIEETIHTSLKYGMAIMTVGALVMYFFPKELYSLFTKDEKVLEIGTSYLKVAALTSWSYMLLGIYISALQGMKKPAFAFLIGSWRQIIVPIFIFTLMTKVYHFGLISIWWSIFTITWISAIISVVYCQSVIKKKINT